MRKGILMTQQEIQKWIYERKDVSPLEAKVLLCVYSQMGLSAAADRLDAIDSANADVRYASVWLWAAERNPERRTILNQLREELTKKYCGENSKDVHLSGRQVFYELSFFTEYETKYGTLQYYENIYRQLCQTEESDRDGWYLYGLTQIKKAMKEGVFEYQAQITSLFKENFAKLRAAFGSLDQLQRILVLAAAYEACSQKILLAYKYQGLLQEWYRIVCRHEHDSDEAEAAMMLMEMAKQKLEA